MHSAGSFLESISYRALNDRENGAEWHSGDFPGMMSLKHLDLHTVGKGKMMKNKCPTIGLALPNSTKGMMK